MAGHHVRVDLLRPDVHRCKVTIENGHIEVSVGEDVVKKIRQSAKTVNAFLSTVTSERSNTMVCLKRSGQITVTRIGFIPVPHCQSVKEKWSLPGRKEILAWSMNVVKALVTLLDPFKHVLATPSRCCPDLERCIGLGIEKLVRGPSRTRLDDINEVWQVCYFTAGPAFDYFANKLFIKRLHACYTGLEICLDERRKTLQFSGKSCTVDDASKYICKCAQNMFQINIPVTHTKAAMLNKPAMQEFVQQMLEVRGLICRWKIEYNMAGGEDQFFFWNLKDAFRRDGSAKMSMIKCVTAIKPDQNELVQIFQSSFKETTLPVHQSQIPLLHSDAWKLFVENLLKTREKPAPVLTVIDNSIVIVDIPSNIRSTRRAVIEFFYNNLIQANAERCGHLVEETITDLQPWQSKFLTMPQAKQYLSKKLEQMVWLASTNENISIEAPFHLMDRYLCYILKYIISLSQQEIPLTAATAQMYKKPTAKDRVQGLMDKANIVCHWEVDGERIVAISQQLHQQQLKKLIESAFTESRICSPTEIPDIFQSHKFKTFVDTLQDVEEGCLAPVVQSGAADDSVIIVSTPENMPAVEKAVVAFLDENSKNPINRVLQQKDQMEPEDEEPGIHHTKHVTTVEELETKLEDTYRLTETGISEYNPVSTEQRQPQNGEPQARERERKSESNRLKNRETQLQKSKFTKEETPNPVSVASCQFDDNMRHTEANQVQAETCQAERYNSLVDGSDNPENQNPSSRFGRGNYFPPLQ